MQEWKHNGHQNIFNSAKERITKMTEIDIEKVIKGLDSCAKWMEENDDDACNNCPYHHSHFSYDDNNCIATVNNDAIALLKEQEPKVLTLEEVEERMLTNDAYDSIFYAEVRTKTKTSFGVFQLNFDSEDYYVAILLGSSFPAWYRKESYGHKWRCWSAKPTNKQRQEVKWNEQTI